jgi:hypothetical protein
LGDEWKEAPAAHLPPVAALRNIQGV